MWKDRFTLGLLAVVVLGLLCANSVYAQFGVFDQTADWGPLGAAHATGNVTVTGSGSAATYEIEGNGDNIGGTQDEGFYVYSLKEGSWMLQGSLAWLDPGFDPNSKLGLMIREKPEADNSQFYYIDIRGEAFGDQTFAEWRLVEGGNTEVSEVFENIDDFEVLEANADGTIWYRIMRFASTNRFVSEWSRDGVEWTSAHQIQLDGWGSSAGIGIAITSNEDDDFLVAGEAASVELVKIPFEANRMIPVDGFIPAVPIQGINVDVIVAEGETPDVVVSENFPAGWTVSNIQATDGEAQVSGDSIVWTLTGASGSPSMTYDVTPPADASSGEWKGNYAGEGFDFNLPLTILNSVTKPSVYFIGNSEADAQRNTIYLDLLGEGLTMFDLDGNEVFVPGLGYQAEFISHDVDDPGVAENFDLVISHEAVSSNAVARYIDLPVAYLAIEQIFYAGRADREASVWFGPQNQVSTSNDFIFIVDDNTHPITDIYERDQIIDVTTNPAGQIGGINFDALAPVATPLMLSADFTRVTLAVAEEGGTGLAGNDGLTPPPGSEPLPARRAMLGLHEAVQAFDLGIAGGIDNIALTPEAAILFQRVVQWMVGVDPTADGTEEGVPVKDWAIY